MFDPESVGYRHDAAAAGPNGFRYDTSVPGNGNEGHLYGTGLSDPQKDALVEYMKTL
jgi:hypothetical protein